MYLCDKTIFLYPLYTIIAYHAHHAIQIIIIFVYIPRRGNPFAPIETRVHVDEFEFVLAFPSDEAAVASSRI